MKELILDTLIDSVKMLPFLLLSYIIIEYIEHKRSDKINNALKKSGKFGNFIGALLGTIPQCGFSVTAANLYAGRIITLGTLVAVFVSTSDEAIPILLSSPGSLPDILKILIIKVIIAVIAGTIIDIVITKANNKKLTKVNIKQDDEIEEHIHHMCSDSDCDCEEHGIFRSALKHTVNIFIYIIIFSFILNFIIYLIGEDRLSSLLLTGSVYQPIIVALIGMIPNCASSILLTQLYLAGNITFASIIAGLVSGAGVGLAVLFKVNEDKKENIKIAGIMYLIAVTSGIILEIFSYLFL